MNNARKKEIATVIQKIEEIKEELESIMSDEEEYRDNMPEYLQDTEQYEQSVNACCEMKNAIDVLFDCELSLDSAQG